MKIKIDAIHIASLVLVLLSFEGLSAQQSSANLAAVKPGPAKKTATSTQPAASAAPDPGQQKFQANCSRCHTAPEQLSPRIVGTVVRHMRVRASLSAEDEQDILRFLAP
jgi:cytochrome c5